MAKTTRSSREYPARPIVGVGGVVLHEGKVLLVKRGRAPLAGAWSLPGGALRTGERITEGIIREVFEETAMHVIPVEQIATLDRIVHDAAGEVQFHYVLIDWRCRLAPGPATPTAGGDAIDAAWAARSALRGMEGLEDLAIDLIEQAMDREGSRA